MPFRKMQWLFPIAVALHNAEEAVYMPGFVSIHGSRLPFHPGSATIRLGLLLMTFAAAAVTYLSARAGRQSVWAYLLFGSTIAMIANVFVPHIPATLAFRGYTPGVVTAVLINLPVMSYIAVKAVREQWVSGRKAVTYALLVPVALAGLIVALFVLHV